MAFGLYFGPQPAGTVAQIMVRKRFAHGHLLGRLNCRHLLAALPGTIRGWGHAQHLTELVQRGIAGAPGDV